MHTTVHRLQLGMPVYYWHTRQPIALHDLQNQHDIRSKRLKRMNSIHTLTRCVCSGLRHAWKPKQMKQTQYEYLTVVVNRTRQSNVW